MAWNTLFIPLVISSPASDAVTSLDFLDSFEFVETTNLPILLLMMEEIVHQLIGSLSMFIPLLYIIGKVCTSQVVPNFLPSTTGIFQEVGSIGRISASYFTCKWDLLGFLAAPQRWTRSAPWTLLPRSTCQLPPFHRRSRMPLHASYHPSLPMSMTSMDAAPAAPILCPPAKTAKNVKNLLHLRPHPCRHLLVDAAVLQLTTLPDHSNDDCWTMLFWLAAGNEERIHFCAFIPLRFTPSLLSGWPVSCTFSECSLNAFGWCSRNNSPASREDSDVRPDTIDTDNYRNLFQRDIYPHQRRPLVEYQPGACGRWTHRHKQRWLNFWW